MKKLITILAMMFCCIGASYSDDFGYNPVDGDYGVYLSSVDGLLGGKNDDAWIYWMIDGQNQSDQDWIDYSQKYFYCFDKDGNVANKQLVEQGTQLQSGQIIYLTNIKGFTGSQFTYAIEMLMDLDEVSSWSAKLEWYDVQGLVRKAYEPEFGNHNYAVFRANAITPEPSSALLLILGLSTMMLKRKTIKML